MKRILITTGGSGGHVLPAITLYNHLCDNFKVFVTSDQRGKKFMSDIDINCEIVDMPNIYESILKLPINFIKLLISIIKTFIFLKKKNISLIISTGGYMSFPFCISAAITGIEIILFEPNMVLGRSNKYFLRFCKKIICYSNKLKNFPDKYKKKIYTINPLLKKDFFKLKKNTPNFYDKEIIVLVIGGSQGAKFFDEFSTILLSNLSKILKIKVFQQIYNNENKEKIINVYDSKKINYSFFTFHPNISDLMLKSDFAITRCGASTLAELVQVNLPFIAVPFPFAKDNHQFYNAGFYKEKNCCWLYNQNDLLKKEVLNTIIENIRNKQQYLSKYNSMKKISSQNNWYDVNKKIINLINEN